MQPSIIIQSAVRQYTTHTFRSVCTSACLAPCTIVCRYRGRQRKLVGGRGIIEKAASNETLEVSDTCRSCASPGPPPIALPQAEMSADASAASTVRPGHSELMSGHGGPVPGHGGPLPGHNGPLPGHGGPLPLQHPRPMEGESGAVRSAITVGPPQP